MDASHYHCNKCGISIPENQKYSCQQKGCINEDDYLAGYIIFLIASVLISIFFTIAWIVSDMLIDLVMVSLAITVLILLCTIGHWKSCNSKK